MIQKPVDQIVANDIISLLENSVREDKSIEYKSQLPGKTDKDKKEFLQDIVAMANSAGGDVLYGIEAIDGVPVKLKGLPDFNEDQERLRLESCIREGISPKIRGLQLHQITGFEIGPILIVRIPRSWSSPHMVSYQRASRFYSRNSAGNFQMDISEIRMAFDASNDLPKQIHAWRDERLNQIITNNGPAHLDSGGILVGHLLPFTSFSNPWRFSASELRTSLLID